MSELRDFVAELLERRGAAIGPLEPDGLEVLAPDTVRDAMRWPELTRLGFGNNVPPQALRVGLEGDWLIRFGALLGQDGRWASRQLALSGPPAPRDPAAAIDAVLHLANAVWRLKTSTAGWTRCLLLSFAYSAVSDEKRDGVVWLGFNQVTGSALGPLVEPLRHALAADDQWQVATQEGAAVGRAWDASTLESRVLRVLKPCVDREIDPFLRAMRRRLDRDGARLHNYHDELRAESLKRLAALESVAGDKADADLRRETLRVEAIEREYRAKLDDLRHNYALRLNVEWVQALELFVPIHRFELEIRRRKGSRIIWLDWHPLLRMAEPPICDWGEGLGAARAVCDSNLHLTEPEGQAPCPKCGHSWCRACSPAVCPNCRLPEG